LKAQEASLFLLKAALVITAAKRKLIEASRKHRHHARQTMGNRHRLKTVTTARRALLRFTASADLMRPDKTPSQHANSVRTDK